jgi:hypothetical protein
MPEKAATQQAQDQVTDDEKAAPELGEVAVTEIEKAAAEPEEEPATDKATATTKSGKIKDVEKVNPDLSQ